MAHLVLVEVLEGKIVAGAKDSYCMVMCGTARKSTSVVTKSANPKWKDKIELSTTGEIKITLWSKSKPADESHGSIDLKLDSLIEKQGKQEGWHALLKKNVKASEVKVRISYIKAIPLPEQEEMNPRSRSSSVSENGEPKQVEKINFQPHRGSVSLRSSSNLSGIAAGLTPKESITPSSSVQGRERAPSVSSQGRERAPSVSNLLDSASGVKKSLAFSDKYILKQTPGQTDLVYKVVVVGDSGVGKTNIFHRYDRNKFSPNFVSTVGADFSSKVFKLPKSGKVVKVQVWDTAGQERFQTVSKQYYRGAVGAIVVYDVTSRASFQHVEEWIKQLALHSQNDALILMLLGNKSDLNEAREVSEEDGKKFAAEKEIDFFETSAMSGLNIGGAIQSLLIKICKTNNDDKGDSKAAIAEKQAKEHRASFSKGVSSPGPMVASPADASKTSPRQPPRTGSAAKLMDSGSAEAEAPKSPKRSPRSSLTSSGTDKNQKKASVKPQETEQQTTSHKANTQKEDIQREKSKEEIPKDKSNEKPKDKQKDDSRQEASKPEKSSKPQPTPQPTPQSTPQPTQPKSQPKTQTTPTPTPTPASTRSSTSSTQEEEESEHPLAEFTTPKPTISIEVVKKEEPKKEEGCPC